MFIIVFIHVWDPFVVEILQMSGMNEILNISQIAMHELVFKYAYRL